MSPNRRDFLTLGVGALAVFTLPRALRPGPVLVRRRIPVMGTVADFVVRHPDEAWAQQSIGVAITELRRVESLMTRFQPDSDVGRINAAAGASVVPISRETGAVLTASMDWSERSGGRFDPCLGAATELWDVGRRRQPPRAAERSGGIVEVGAWRSLEVEDSDAGSSAGLARAATRLDLGGIAKGYGVDRAVSTLRDHGIFHALVNVGGDLAALGVDGAGEPWRIGIRSPWATNEVVEELRVSDRAVATSGDYMHFFEHGGHTYHHLLDPETGEPRQTTMRSLTVEADDCMAADAAATTLFGADPATSLRILAHAPSRVRVVHSI